MQILSKSAKFHNAKYPGQTPQKVNSRDLNEIIFSPMILYCTVRRSILLQTKGSLISFANSIFIQQKFMLYQN